MYLDEYKRWMAAELEDADLKPELAKIEGNDDEIKDRFAVALKFGTAGLRGVLGAGTNRMNIYVVRQATQGLANWVKTQGGSQTVAISYDSRLKSDIFAKTAAGVLAANGIKVRIYDALMPVPALSFATRYYQCKMCIRDRSFPVHWVRSAVWPTLCPRCRPGTLRWVWPAQASLPWLL